MNTKVLLMAVVFATGLFLTSCSKDEDKVSKPVISDLEIGLNNSKEAYIGADLHIEAEIVAEGKIDKVTVEIHQEEGSDEEIVAVFDDYSGLKNATLHKHIDIPEKTVAGEYHCHIIVTDMEGNSTTAEEHVDIKELVDTEAPKLTISSQPESGKVFKKGDKITIKGHIEDNTKLAGMLVALVYKSDNIADKDVTGKNKQVIVMLHTHDFEDPDEVDFTAEIEVGAEKDNNMTPAALTDSNKWKSGEYYILVRCKDVKGNWVFSKEHRIIKIEM